MLEDTHLKGVPNDRILWNRSMPMRWISQVMRWAQGVGLGCLAKRDWQGRGVSGTVWDRLLRDKNPG